MTTRSSWNVFEFESNNTSSLARIIKWYLSILIDTYHRLTSFIYLSFIVQLGTARSARNKAVHWCTPQYGCLLFLGVLCFDIRFHYLHYIHHRWPSLTTVCEHITRDPRGPRDRRNVWCQMRKFMGRSNFQDRLFCMPNVCPF